MTRQTHPPPLLDYPACRYGKIYRGDKAKFAEQYGLAGLMIYMDAQQYAPEGTPVYPEGLGLPTSGVQRGTIKTGFGDPSTHLFPSTGIHQIAPS